MELILLLFSIAVFITFTLFVGIKYGVQKSISASIYVLHGTLEKSYYSWFILGVAIPMMLISNTTLGWWAGALLAIDFAAPAGGDKMQNFLHSFGADAGMVIGLGMLIYDFHLLPLVVCNIVFILYAHWRIKNSVWWIETSIFITVIIGLLIAKIL